MPMSPIDYRVYLVTDRRLLNGRRLDEVVEQAILGGTGIVQLREKHASDTEILEWGGRLRDLCRAHGACFILNDRPDLARELDADGVHVGQSDASYAEARRVLGSERIVGVSVSTVDEARAAEIAGADYLGISPVFDTPSKIDTPTATGLEGLRDIRRAVTLPLVGIGGVDASNAAAVVAAGADGVAVIRAIMGEPNPATAARNLRQAVGEGLARR